MTFDGPESRWYRLVILCNRGARPHLLSATGGCRALRGEGQPCPRKPTICPTNQFSLQCHIRTFQTAPSGSEAASNWMPLVFSFDDLVDAGEDRGRNCQAELLRRLE